MKALKFILKMDPFPVSWNLKQVLSALPFFITTTTSTSFRVVVPLHSGTVVLEGLAAQLYDTDRCPG